MLELVNTVNEVKNASVGLIGRLLRVNEIINELKDRSVKILYTECKEKQSGKKKLNIQKKYGTIIKSVIEIPEREKSMKQKKYLK